MNITPVNFKLNFQNNISLKANSTQILPKYKSSPAKDTVSFSGGINGILKEASQTIEEITGKVMDGRTKDISYKIGKEIHEEAVPALTEFMNVLKRGLRSLVETESHPNNPIAREGFGIKGRVKGANSIIEKALSKKLVTKSEIANMGDVVATRIVLRDSSQESFDLVFKSLEKMVREGNLNVKEVENYRILPKDSYISNKTLTRFEETCIRQGLNPTIISKSRDNAYTAIHITILLPNKQLAEIQIMGIDVEQAKEIEDFYYKLRCKKEFAPKYKHIQKMMKEKLAKLTKFQKETLGEYIKDSYIHARAIPATETHPEYSTKKFIDLPYSLPPELGYRYLFKMKEAADFVAKVM